MKYTIRALFCATMFLLCTAEGCPSKCERQSDCDSGESCRGYTDGSGEHLQGCFPDNPTGRQVGAAAAAGYHVDAVTVSAGTSGANIAVTVKRDE